MPSDGIAVTWLKCALAAGLPMATVSVTGHGAGSTQPAAAHQYDVPIIEVEDPARQIPIGSDGAFHAQASINGVPVNVVVDSGATLTILTEADARRAGILTSPMRFDRKLRTVSGVAMIALARVERLAVAGKTFTRVPVAVVRADHMPSLIGNDVLNRFERVIVADGVIEFHSSSAR